MISLLGLYVVSTKMSGFTMDVANSDPNMVICGIRVLLGSQDVARTPSYVEVRIILVKKTNICFNIELFFNIWLYISGVWSVNPDNRSP